MARSKNNVLTRTYSGRCGNACFQADGVLRSRPDMSDRKLSEKQEQHLSRFESAKEYARQVVKDAEKSAFYAKSLKRWKKKKGNVGVYQLAIMNFMHPPVILSVKRNPWNQGNAHTIIIEALDQFGIRGATVRLVTRNGTILEEGEAGIPLHSVYYQYVIKDPLLLQQQVIIRVRTWGMPGIVTEKDFHWFC